MGRKKKDGLESEVLELPQRHIKRDHEGRYVPFCDFRHHRGFIINEKVCMSRKCQYHHRLYINYKKRRNNKHDNGNKTRYENTDN